MTTKTISTTINGGYSLSNSYQVLTITSAGTINGYFPGGLGLEVSFAAETYNSGLIAGAGAGPHGGGIATGDPGGGGASLGGGTFSNSGTVSGGYGNGGQHIKINGGGYNGALGGTGGNAVDMTAAGMVLNSGTIGGGAGGPGGGAVGGSNGYGTYYQARAGDGGVGGAGVILGAGGSVNNTGRIVGGAGGAAGVAYGKYAYAAYAGAQGSGVLLKDGGVVTNGGALASPALISGGVLTEGAAATITNTGTIAGSNNPGYAIDYGVDLEAGGRVINGGPGVSSALITYGVNFSAPAAATLVNYGTVLDGSFFGASGDRLVAEPGSYLAGVFVNAGLGVRATLELVSGAETATDVGVNATITGAVTMSASYFSAYLVDAADSLTLTGVNRIRPGFSLIGQGTVALTAGAALNVDNGGLVELQGAVANAGTIALASTGSRTDLRVLAAGVTMSGGGAVTLTGPKSRIWGTATTATLTNVDNTISGQGWLGLSEMTLVNESAGVIEAVGKQGLVVNTKGETAVNAGVIESAAGSVLTLQNSTLNQSGGGTLAALTGGRVLLSDDVVIGGTLGQAGTGVFNVNASGGKLAGAADTVTISGAVRVLGAVSLTLDGAIANAGKLNTHGGATVSKLIVGSHGVTLTGGGQVNTTASLNNIIVGAASTDTLTNVDNRIAGAGDIGDGSMVLINKGQIVGSTAVTLTLDTGASAITNSGTISSVSTGQVVVKSALANTGLIFAAAGTLTLDGAVTGTGTGQIKNGVLDIAASFGETVTFVSGATGQLRLTDWADFTGTVKGLSLTGANTIDLAGFTKTGAIASYNGTTASGVLTVTNGTQTAKIHLTGNYTASTFTVANDGSGGVLVKDPEIVSAAPLAQAMAGFQHGPALHLAATPAYGLPRFPMLVARA